MRSAFRAGAAYFAIVFAAGAALGTLRVVALAPRFGEAGAVTIELPVMLALAWLVCAWLITRLSMPPALAPRLTMGGFAFGLLIAAEIGVSVFGFGRTMVEHFETYRTAPAVMGLAGQVAFALFPAIQLSAARRADGEKRRP